MDATNFLTLRRLQRALENGDPQAINLYAYAALRSDNQTVRTIARKMIQTSDVTAAAEAHASKMRASASSCIRVTGPHMQEVPE